MFAPPPVNSELKRFGAALGAAAALVLAGCSQPSSSPGRTIEPETHGQALIKEWKVTEPAGAVATITNQDITIVAPDDADLGSVTSAVTLSPGASITPDPAQPTDFKAGPLTFTVRAADGDTSTPYTVTARQQAVDDMAITAFEIGTAAGTIDNSENTITIVVAGDALTNLTPTITFIGAAISPASGEPQDFSSGPVDYIVTALNGNTRRYKASAVSAQKVSKEITSFLLDSGQENDGQTFTIANSGATGGLITLTVPEGTNIMHTTAKIAFSGASIKPSPGDAQDFSNPLSPVHYEVQAEDGSVRTYTVQVTVAPASDNTIRQFSISLTGGLSVLGIITGTNIAVTVPFSTQNLSLTPNIAIPGDANIEPASGAAQDFSKGPVTYTVTAKNGAKKTYTVTVTKAANTDCSITVFQIPQGITTINESAKTIAVEMPYGTNRTSLEPTISHTGASISPASGAAQNFSSQVQYTVNAAQEGTSNTYTVTVTEAAVIGANVSGVTANGKSWTTETTELTLTFNKDLGSAFTTNNITIESGATKGTMTRVNSLGSYKLLVSDITQNDNSITVKIAAPQGYTLNSKSEVEYYVTVFKAPAKIDVKALTQVGGKSGKDATTALELTFDKDIPDLAAGDLGLTTDTGTVTKGALTSKGDGKYELAVSGISVNNINVKITPAKTGYAFYPASLTTAVFKEASPNATLTALLVDGQNLNNFGPGTLNYVHSSKTTSPIKTATVRIKATAAAGATIKYKANTGLAITSGVEFTSATINPGVKHTIELVVTAEDRVTDQTYCIDVYRGNNNANLGGISVSPATNVGAVLYPAPDPAITEYALYATAFNSFIKITPTVAQYSDATLVIRGGTANSNSALSTEVPHSNDMTAMHGQTAYLTESAMSDFSKVTIVITAEDGATTKTYTINKYAKAATYSGGSTGIIPQARGGTITFAGNDEIHTFWTGTYNQELTDTLTFLMPNKMPATVRALLLGGGGREGAGGKGIIFAYFTGGGGAGGQVVEDKALKLTSASSYPVKVGKRTNEQGQSGTESTFGGKTAKGGGGGWAGKTYNPDNGFGVGGKITATGVPQGGSGGDTSTGTLTNTLYYGSGGGAGAGENGKNGSNGKNAGTGGAGGAGVKSDITNSNIEYGAGGRGGDGYNTNGLGGNTDRQNGNGVVIVRFTRK